MNWKTPPKLLSFKKKNVIVITKILLYRVIGDIAVLMSFFYFCRVKNEDAIFQVWWVIETIGTLQVKTCSGPNNH